MALYGTGSNVNQTTDVSAGNYGSTSAVPVITVDSDKRISAINTATIVLDATVNANASVGDVGTYAFLQQSGAENSATNPGSTLAGSSLRYSDATGRPSNTSPSGNWRCMGYDSGAALTNSGTVGGSAAGNAALSGGNVQGDVTASVSGNIQGDASLASGNVTNNTNVNVAGNIQGGKGGSFNVTPSVDTDELSVSGNIATDDLSITGNTGTIATDELSVAGNVSVNVNLGSITVNTTVAYSSTLWLRYS